MDKDKESTKEVTTQDDEELNEEGVELEKDAESEDAEVTEESSETKSKADRFITKFSRFYTPCVLGIALLTMVVPPLFLGINQPDVWKQ